MCEALRKKEIWELQWYRFTNMGGEEDFWEVHSLGRRISFSCQLYTPACILCCLFLDRANKHIIQWYHSFISLCKCQQLTLIELIFCETHKDLTKVINIVLQEQMIISMKMTLRKMSCPCYGLHPLRVAPSTVHLAFVTQQDSGNLQLGHGN